MLVVGKGTEATPCSMSAINLVLTGELTDDIPLCMNYVLGKWIINVQDMMPHAVRNSDEWKGALPLAPRVSRLREEEVQGALIQWLWERVLPVAQEEADACGAGDLWKEMVTAKTVAAAKEADKKLTYLQGRASQYEEAELADEPDHQRPGLPLSHRLNTLAFIAESVIEVIEMGRVYFKVPDVAHDVLGASCRGVKEGQEMREVRAWQAFAPWQIIHDLAGKEEDV